VRFNSSGATDAVIIPPASIMPAPTDYVSNVEPNGQKVISFMNGTKVTYNV